MSELQPQRRWFPFSLRSLLVFVTLCTVPRIDEHVLITLRVMNPITGGLGS